MPTESRRREPERTRADLLDAAYQEIHLHGFQAASMSDILTRAGLTKGALYYHFDGKLQLGYAVLDEVVAQILEASWITPIENAGSDFIPVMIWLLQQAAAEMTEEDIELGCPLNNLAQEMSPIDEGFRTRINTLFDRWQSVLSKGLIAGIKAGEIKDSVDPKTSAIFLVATLEGCVGMAKHARSRATLISCAEGLVAYLAGLATK